MSFATEWLDKRALFPEIITETPDNQTGIIVVVPAFNESEISVLLGSLARCTEPDCKVEVIIVVNAPADADKESIRHNKECIINIKSWKKENPKCFFRLFVFDAGQPSIDKWGVGLARKAGMDEALRRFNSIGKPEGVIVSLDADCIVEKNYFASICDNLLKKKEHSACSIYFEHPVSGKEYPEKNYKYIILYELHLRYYLQSLKFTCFPYAFHTVGSAIAVKAVLYVKAGGMNRRQAGEDFYFVQNLVGTGGYFSLNTTTVYPSPRESYRVPFGTGPSIIKLIDNTSNGFLTYNIDAFKELRQLFSTTTKLFRSSYLEILDFHKALPDGLKSFIDGEEWSLKIDELNKNSSSEESFVKRFFGWFNMFKIVKYLNHVHSDIFEKQSVADAASLLLSLTGHKFSSNDPKKLLIFFRSLEKG